MPSLLASCEELFHTRDLYAVLELEKTATSGQIKKAYHKVSLKVHPDRVSDAERAEATKKFQCVGAVYAVLSDDSRRGLYDECGEVDDEQDPLQHDKDWEEYWRLLFPKITLKDIEKFEKEYRESEEEKKDVIKAYVECEGDMDQILDSVMCSREEDEDRFRAIIDAAIKEKTVKTFKAYKKTTGAKAKQARKRAAESEAKEAEQARKELGLDGSEESLANMILARQQSRGQQAESFLDGLAAKYGGGAKNGSAGKKKTKK